MSKTAVMGEKESVQAFGALGMSTFFAKNKEEAKKTLSKLVKSDFAVIYVTEKTAEYIEEETEELRFKPTPAIILIPGINGNTNKGMEQMNISVKKAVGSDILK